MFWIIAISSIWIIALVLMWLFMYQAGRINDKFDRDAATYIDRLLQHAESRGLENFRLDTRPSFLEEELLTSRRKVAKALEKKGGKP